MLVFNKTSLDFPRHFLIFFLIQKFYQEIEIFFCPLKSSDSAKKKKRINNAHIVARLPEVPDKMLLHMVGAAHKMMLGYPRNAGLLTYTLYSCSEHVLTLSTIHTPESRGIMCVALAGVWRIFQRKIQKDEKDAESPGVVSLRSHFLLCCLPSGRTVLKSFGESGCHHFTLLQI